MLPRILKTIILASTLVFAAVLWMTRDEFMISQSAFALSDNNHWYWLMHISIIVTFVLDWLHHSRLWSLAVSVASALVLAFDMYHFPWLHNFFTGLMAALAVFNVIYFASKKERPYAIMNSGVGVLVFMLGFLGDVHLFFGEVVIEFTIGVSMIRRIWED